MAKRRSNRFSSYRPSVKTVGYTLLTLILLVSVLEFSGQTHLFHKSKATTTASANNKNSTSKSVGNIDYSPAKPGDNTANNQRKGSATSSSTIPQSTPSTSPTTQTKPVISIAGANKDSGSPGNIIVSATVENISSGTCTFNFSRSSGGAVVKSQNEAVQYTGTYYSCPPLSVAMPQPADGNWYVRAILTSGGQTATDKWPSSVTL